jgi:hypothetical protein
MTEIVKLNIELAGKELEWTVLRVPFLTDGPGRSVVAGELNATYPWTRTLSQKGQAKWLLKEVDEREFVGKYPVLNDAK